MLHVCLCSGVISKFKQLYAYSKKEINKVVINLHVTFLHKASLKLKKTIINIKIIFLRESVILHKVYEFWR